MSESTQTTQKNPLAANAPDAMRAMQGFEKAAMGDGAIPAKYKELMAVAVAHTTQCEYCIEMHNQKARDAGASDAELAEAVMVSAVMRAGAAVMHGVHNFESD